MHSEEERLVAKLRKIEALFARPATQGEKVAAENALERIRERLRLLEKVEPALEYRFPLHDTWSKSLFIALLRRYGITPCGYRGQRRTTVMAKVTRTGDSPSDSRRCHRRRGTLGTYTRTRWAMKIRTDEKPGRWAA